MLALQTKAALGLRCGALASATLRAGLDTTALAAPARECPNKGKLSAELSLSKEKSQRAAKNAAAADTNNGIVCAASLLLLLLCCASACGQLQGRQFFMGQRRNYAPRG